MKQAGASVTDRSQTKGVNPKTENSKLRYGVDRQGALKHTQERRVCLYYSVRVERQRVADCDSTDCAELQRERRKCGTAYRKKKQIKVRIRIQQRKDRL
jgi:hypothetical protein